ncbi:gfo/Idh/MocA family oxidoreductase [Altererythrobacter soli]|uniref:Gfo/Idh/MocA family oxidoreductase n=1 Tax=Croceibacterium soli TaxID=1739690 RepID=A0A6I4URB8_9SPHN|nr:Gfo/Idh/MocA family oxidoreductase [Croceibacterium soli]MXP40284.1 gfo/Idh/MocA family oxidoreductase [Croceibacterium soli]
MSRPRVGFLGTGWIGRHRMQAIVAGGAVEAVAVSDPDPDCAAQAADLAPGAAVLPSLEGLLDHGLDGLVIATPSALHAEQAIAALDRGVAVFCQKPLGRNEAEARGVIEAARQADRLLAVDLSYRRTAVVEAIAGPIRGDELGQIFAVDLAFHNAYGPDKPWFYDRTLSGGGCVIDLGVHLVDLALWLLGFPEVERVQSRLFAGGQPLSAGSNEVEDYALATLDLAGGTAVRLACSWHLHAGRDAAIEADFHGTAGSVSIRNVAGSFYDFEAHRHRGTSTERIAAPPDDWGGRAAAAWAERLAQDRSFDAEALHLAQVSRVLDRIYEGG